MFSEIKQIIQNSVDIFCSQISEKYDLEKDELIEIWNQVSEQKNTTPIKTKKVLSPSPTDLPSPSLKVPPTACPYVFSRGANKGTTCNCKPRSGSIYCSKHIKYEQDATKASPKVSPNKPVPKSSPEQKSIINTANKSKKSVVSETEPKSPNRDLVLRINKSIGHFWHPDTKMVFGGVNKKEVIGICIDDKLCDLTEMDIETCKRMNFKISEDQPQKPTKESSENDSDSDSESEENTPSLSNTVGNIKTTKKQIADFITETADQALEVEKILDIITYKQDNEDKEEDEEEDEDEEEMEDEY